MMKLGYGYVLLSARDVVRNTIFTAHKVGESLKVKTPVMHSRNVISRRTCIVSHDATRSPKSHYTGTSTLSHQAIVQGTGRNKNRETAGRSVDEGLHTPGQGARQDRQADGQTRAGDAAEG